MKNTLKKFTILGDAVTVTVADTTELVEKAREIHDMSPLATAALGRTLTVASFMSARFKDENATMSVVIDGGGPIGKITVVGDFGGHVRGYVDNPVIDLPLNAVGKLDVGAAVGKNGAIRCVTDLRMKEPYLGQADLISGEIGEDFAYYFVTSEQQPSAVAVGVLCGSTGVLAAGGVFMQPLPGTDENIIVMLEDIATNFTNVSTLIKDIGIDGIIENYFSHLGVKIMEEIHPEYRCSCSKEKIDGIIMTLPTDDIEDILTSEGKINVQCHFCNKNYTYTREDVEKLKKDFGKK